LPASARENIRFGRPDDHRRGNHRRRRAAAAHGSHALTDGYDSLLGASVGVMLSGGKRQRIAIARAILARRRRCCVDEATSALGRRSERACRPPWTD